MEEPEHDLFSAHKTQQSGDTTVVNTSQVHLIMDYVSDIPLNNMSPLRKQDKPMNISDLNKDKQSKSVTFVVEEPTDLETQQKVVPKENSICTVV